MAEVRRSGCVAVPGALTSENFRRLIAARDCEAGDGWFAWMRQYLSILSYQQRSCLKEKLVESDIMRWSTSWYVTHLFETALHWTHLDTWNRAPLLSSPHLNVESVCFARCSTWLFIAPPDRPEWLSDGVGWSVRQEGSGNNRNNQSFIQDSLAFVQIETQIHSNTMSYNL